MIWSLVTVGYLECSEPSCNISWNNQRELHSILGCSILIAQHPDMFNKNSTVSWSCFRPQSCSVLGCSRRQSHSVLGCSWQQLHSVLGCFRQQSHSVLECFRQQSHSVLGMFSDTYQEFCGVLR